MDGTLVFRRICGPCFELLTPFFVQFLSPCQFTDTENKMVSRARVTITLRSKKRENSCISSSHLRGLPTGVSSDTSVSEKIT